MDLEKGRNGSKPWIRNCSLKEIKEGDFPNPGENSYLIQILDPGASFPTTKHKFSKVTQLNFIDMDGSEDREKYGDLFEFLITDGQALQIFNALEEALMLEMNVIVHCFMGVSRSGAVCDVGIRMGFADKGQWREPNRLVFKKIMEAGSYGVSQIEFPGDKIWG